MNISEGEKIISYSGKSVFVKELNKKGCRHPEKRNTPRFGLWEKKKRRSFKEKKRTRHKKGKNGANKGREKKTSFTKKKKNQKPRKRKRKCPKTKKN